MKAKLYIDSEDSTIKIEGGPSDVLHLGVRNRADSEELFPGRF